MKSLGLPEALVRRIFVLEAMLIGIMGMLGGFALGYLLSFGLESYKFPVPFGNKDHLPMAYEPMHYVIAGGVALVSSVVAGYFPARKAASVHPVDIIRGAS